MHVFEDTDTGHACWRRASIKRQASCQNLSVCLSGSHSSRSLIRSKWLPRGWEHGSGLHFLVDNEPLKASRYSFCTLALRHICCAVIALYLRGRGVGKLIINLLWTGQLVSGALLPPLLSVLSVTISECLLTGRVSVTCFKEQEQQHTWAASLFHLPRGLAYRTGDFLPSCLS